MCPSSAFSHAEPSTANQQPAEVDVPPTKICQDAFALATSVLPPAILNHSIRVYKYAKILAERSESEYFKSEAKHDILFVSCLLHDFGATDAYDGPQRFEIEGADAAVALLREHKVKEEDAHEAWMAIALHTSPGIAERINELCRLVRQAVLVDFHRNEDVLEDTSDLRKAFEEIYPRLGIEKVLGDAVAAQAVKNPRKAPPSSWPNSLYRAYLAEPDWDGVNKGF
jgi:HD superfamily phosphohydrolase YqeK